MPKKKKKKPAVSPVTEPVVQAEANSNEYEALSGTLPLYYSLWDKGNVLTSYSMEMIANMVGDPMAYNKPLRDISRALYNINGIYTNTVDYMTSMPTLDYVLTCLGGKSDKTRKQMKTLADNTLDAIRHKQLIRDALRRAMIDGVAFYYFEKADTPVSMQKYLNDFEIGDIAEINESGMSFDIIPLPADYTRVYCRKNGSYVLAFDLTYFMIGTEPIEKKLRRFPLEIRQGYKKWISQNSDEKGKWLVLDSDKTITLKIRSNLREPFGRPLCLAAITDILYENDFVDTKRNVLNGINNEVWIQTFPESNNKGQTTLTKQQQKSQHEQVKTAIRNKGTVNNKTVISVMAGTKIDHVPASNVDILDEKYEADLDDKIAMYLGIAGSLLSGSGSGSYSAQQSNLELVSSQVFEWVSQITDELIKVLNKNVISKRGYRAELFYLPVTSNNRKSVISYYKDLYTMGKGSIQLWASAAGVPSEVFFSLIEEEKAMGWDDPILHPIHQTSFSGTFEPDTEAGRPETDEPTDATIANRSLDGNNIPSPNN